MITPQLLAQATKLDLTEQFEAAPLVEKGDVVFGEVPVELRQGYLLRTKIDEEIAAIRAEAKYENDKTLQERVTALQLDSDHLDCILSYELVRHYPQLRTDRRQACLGRNWEVYFPARLQGCPICGKHIAEMINDLLNNPPLVQPPIGVLLYRLFDGFKGQPKPPAEPTAETEPAAAE